MKANPYLEQSLPGALREYNGKFMSSQMILRWQFSGIRLAR